IGWGHAYLAQGGLMAGLVWALGGLFPPDEGPGRGGKVGPSPAGGRGGPGGPSRRGRGAGGAVRHTAFRAPVPGFPCTGLGSFFVSLHQLAFAVDVGFDKLYAASVLGLGALLSVAGVIVTGTLSDYIGRELSAVLAYVVSIVGVICALFITGPDHAWLLWIHACF